MDLANVFTDIHESNKWGSAESRSGPGSSLAVTATVRSMLPLLCRALGVRVLMDAPCGDMNWMRETTLPVERYIGVDVVESVVQANKAAYGSASRDFLTIDLTSGPLPDADLVLSRDFLVHLTERDALKALVVFQHSCRYLLTTTFYATRENLKGSNGGWRPINLQVAPFDFPPPIFLAPERHFGDAPYSDKALGLWDLAGLTLPDPG